MNDFSAEAEVEETAAEVEEVEEETVTDEDPEAETEDIEGDEESEEGEEQEQEPAELEFNFGGEKFAVNKSANVEEVAEKLQSYINSVQTAHNKRSEIIAETSKSLEAREQALSKMENMSNELLDTYSMGIALENELKQLERTDLTQLFQTNPDQYRLVSDQISQKRGQLAQVQQVVAQQEAQFQEARQGEIKRRLEEGEQIVERQIPGFSSKVPAIKEYVTKNFSVSKENAELWALNPAGAIMAYESMMYREMQSKAKSKPKPKTVNPVLPVKGKGKKVHAKPLNQVQDPEEYRRRFQKSKQKARTG